MKDGQGEKPNDGECPASQQEMALAMRLYEELYRAMPGNAPDALVVLLGTIAFLLMDLLASKRPDISHKQAAQDIETLVSRLFAQIQDFAEARGCVNSEIERN